MKKAPRDVDAYIAAAPRKMQPRLREVRAAIRKVAPDAAENISYGMPFYDYKGRLAWFGLQRTHIGLYLRPPVIAEHERELSKYVTTKSAVQLPLDREIPVSLIKKLVRARMKLNQEEGKTRTSNRNELNLIREWYDYNSIVRKRYFQVISKLPEAELTKDRGASFPSILDIFTHVLDAYRWWFLYVYIDKVHERKMLRDTGLRLDEIKQEEHKIDSFVKKFLQKLSTKDLAQAIVWHEVDPKGKRWTIKITMRDMLWTLVSEELQHRGELNALLWQIDIDPPIIEWVDFWTVGKEK